MNQATRLDIFEAQTQNVREISKAQIQIKRAINNAIRRGDIVAVDALTKTMALVFCAWVEANFSKVIHTPHGYSLDEIQQIKNVYKGNGLERGWEKCIELGTLKASASRNSNYMPNIRQELGILTHKYIVEPSLLRNKIAHGQWKIALNRHNTATNNELTNALVSLDIVTIYKWFRIHEHISQIVEALIESPNRTFHRDYWVEITKLNEFLDKSESWNMDQKAYLLKRKPIPIISSKQKNS